MDSSNRVGSISVTLLGTGTPIPDRDRHGPSQLIKIARDLVFVDCGPGTLHRLLEAESNVSAISHVLLTHLHSDHVSGLADLLWAGWVGRWWTTPPVFVGPPGTEEFIKRLLYAFEEDIRLRTEEGSVTIAGLHPSIHEIEDGWTKTFHEWSVKGFRVDHYPVKHAFGYRFEHDKNVVVISGDTCICENLQMHAQDADIFVCEVVWEEGIKRAIETSHGPDKARWERILRYHMSSLEVGKVAANARVKHLVLSHLMLMNGSPADLLVDVRSSFDGKLTVGEDLAKFSTKAE